MAGRDLLAPAGRNLLASPSGSIGVPPAQQQPAQQPSLMERLAGNPTIQKLVNSQQAQDLTSPGKAFQAADDLARIGADTASFGFADPAIGYFTGADERAKTKAARDRAGWAGTGMDVVTALETAPNLLAGKLLPAAKGAWPAVQRAFGYGAEGAGQAAVSALGHGERDPAQLLMDAGIGGTLGAAGSAIGGKVGSWLERRRAKANQPYKDTQAVKDASSAKYKVVDQSGAHYPAAESDKLLKTFDDVLAGEDATAGIDDRALAWVAKRRADWGGNDMPVAKLEKLRRSIDKKLVGSDPRSSDAQIGLKLKAEIDDFMKKNVPVDPATGQALPEVTATLKEARDLSARGKRAAEIEKASAKAGPGENARRRQFTKLGEKIDERGGRGYSPDEVSRIKAIAKGTLARTAANAAGVLSPFRGPVQLLGHVMTGGTGLPLGMAAEGAMQLGRRATSRDINDLTALVRDPSGKGLTTDPAKVQQIRDLLARVMVGGARVGGGP